MLRADLARTARPGAHLFAVELSGSFSACASKPNNFGEVDSFSLGDIEPVADACFVD